MLVERLQHQAALELAHELGPDLRLLARVLRERGLDQPVAQRLVGELGSLFSHSRDRRLRSGTRAASAVSRPGMSHCSSTDSGGT